MRQYLSAHVWWRVSIIYTGIFFVILSASFFAGNGVLKGELPTAHAAASATIDDKKVIAPVRITIPSQSIDLSIAPGEYDAKSGWSVEKQMANYIPTMVSIGEPGALTVYGHDTPEVFSRIKNMQPGTEVRITASDGNVYQYLRDVSPAKIVAPDDVSILNEKTDHHKIYLLTCDGWRSEKRYVASLKLKEKR